MDPAIARLPYKAVWLIDSEYMAPAGERPIVHCLVAREARSGRTLRLWADTLRACMCPPFGTDADALVVAFYASAEMAVFRALGWPLPRRLMCLFTEFRRITNGVDLPSGSGLLGALNWYGLDTMGADEKRDLRALAMRGGPFTEREKTALLDYCESDVHALERLLPRMLQDILAPRTRTSIGARPVSPSIALGQALLRGRFMCAAAKIEMAGVPIDVPTLRRLRRHWGTIKARLIETVDARFGVFVGGSFSMLRFEAYLRSTDKAWPLRPDGRLDLRELTFRDMALAHPELRPLHELRVALSALRLNDLAVGADGRNRVLLSAFRSRTGRNQPSNSRFIFGPSRWLRGLIKPGAGLALAYVDWSAQEIGIAAALSGDQALTEAYRSGDVYLDFAVRSGLAPAGATAASHAAARDLCKRCVLSLGYGIGAHSLAARIARPPIEARELMQLHRLAYSRFWRWVEESVTGAVLHRGIWTCFGWFQHVGDDFNPRSLMNFNAQAHGAEILRLAACLATERELTICAPIHDAILLEAALEEIEVAVVELQDCMREAGQMVLGGFELAAKASIVRHPDRYMDDAGVGMWTTVMRLIGEVEEAETA